MGNNPKGYYTKYFTEKRNKLIELHGGKCILCGNTNIKDLEFAHTKKNGFNGMGRGRSERYTNISQNPDKYTLLCKKPCHKEFDALEDNTPEKNGLINLINARKIGIGLIDIQLKKKKHATLCTKLISCKECKIKKCTHTYRINHK